MVKNNLEEQIFKKIVTRSASISMLLDYYDEEDNIDLYVFDLIAYILNNPRKNYKDVMDRDLECWFLLLFDNVDSSYEVNLAAKNISEALKIIDNYNFSDEVMTVLQQLFVYNEMLVDCDYKLNSINLSRIERIKLRGEYRDIERELKSSFDRLHLHMLRIGVEKKVEPLFIALKKKLENKNIDLNKYIPTGWKKNYKKNDEQQTEEETIKKPKK